MRMKKTSILAALAAFAAVVLSCSPQEKATPSGGGDEQPSVDETPAALLSFALLAADNPGILSEDIAVAAIQENMVLRIDGGGVGKTLKATLTAGENDVIKVNDAEVDASGKASFDATYPVDITVTNSGSGKKASYVVKVGKILKVVKTNYPSYTETADCSMGTDAFIAVNEDDGTPFVLYNRKLKVDGSLESNNNLSVAKWNGSSFEILGKSGIADNSIRQPVADDLAISPDHKVYVLHHGEKTANFFGMKVFDGTGWRMVGDQEIGVKSTTAYGLPSIYFNNNLPGYAGTNNVGKSDNNYRCAVRYNFDGAKWNAENGIPGLPTYGAKGGSDGVFYTARTVSVDNMAYAIVSVNQYGYYIYKIQNGTWTRMVENSKLMRTDGSVEPEEPYGIPGNLDIQIGPDGKVYTLCGMTQSQRMQIMRFNPNSREFAPFGEPFPMKWTDTGAPEEAALFRINPVNGQIIGVKTGSLVTGKDDEGNDIITKGFPFFAVMDENRQWSEWTQVSDVPMYGDPDIAITPDGTVYVVYVSRDASKVQRLEMFSLAVEPDDLAE